MPPMEIDVIGADPEQEADPESIENWMEDEVERRMRRGRDPTYDYMNRDPRNPERYPMGSGGEVNFGLRVRETVNPKAISGKTMMGVRSGGQRPRLYGQMKRMTAAQRAAVGRHQSFVTEEAAALASLGYFGHTGLGEDDAVYGAEALQTMTVNPDLGFSGLGDEEVVFIDYDGLGADLVETFLTPKYDGLGVRLDYIGWSLPKLPDIGKAVGNAIKGASEAVGKAASTAAKAIGDGYQKLASAVDINKGNKDKLIAQMNGIKGRVKAMDNRDLKNPKSITRLKELQAEYATIAQRAGKEKIAVDALDLRLREAKAQGVAAVVGMAAQIKHTGAVNSPAAQAGQAVKKPLTQGEAAKLKGLGYSDDEIIAIDYLGIAPLVIAAGAAIAIAATVAAALAWCLSQGGKLEAKVATSEKEVNKWENEWTQGEKVPFDPKTQPYTEVLTDPQTGKTLGVRVGDTLKMQIQKGEQEKEKSRVVETKQEGQAKADITPEGYIKTTTGEPAKAAQEQESILGKIWLGSIPWYVWAAAGVGAVAVIYVIATSKKTPPPQPPQQQNPPRLPRTTMRALPAAR